MSAIVDIWNGARIKLTRLKWKWTRTQTRTRGHETYHNEVDRRGMALLQSNEIKCPLWLIWTKTGSGTLPLVNTKIYRIIPHLKQSIDVIKTLGLSSFYSRKKMSVLRYYCQTWYLLLSSRLDSFQSLSTIPGVNSFMKSHYNCKMFKVCRRLDITWASVN